MTLYQRGWMTHHRVVGMRGQSTVVFVATYNGGISNSFYIIWIRVYWPIH